MAVFTPVLIIAVKQHTHKGFILNNIQETHKKVLQRTDVPPVFIPRLLFCLYIHVVQAQTGDFPVHKEEKKKHEVQVVDDHQYAIFKYRAGSYFLSWVAW